MTTAATWTFRWGDALVDGLFPSTQTGWILEGRPRATPAQEWLVAHDVCHHEPGDTGSYAEEVASFGAQAWFESHASDQERFETLATAWFSVMALVLEQGRRGVEGLLLPAVNEVSLPSPIRAEFEALYTHALIDIRDEFGAWATPALWAQLASPDMTRRAVAAAGRGYLRAQQRWPDGVRAGRVFQALCDQAGPGVEGETFQVSIDARRVVRMARALPGEPPAWQAIEVDEPPRRRRRLG